MGNIKKINRAILNITTIEIRIDKSNKYLFFDLLKRALINMCSEQTKIRPITILEKANPGPFGKKRKTSGKVNK